MSKEAMKLALEALKQIDEAMPFPVAKLAQSALREALAEQKSGIKQVIELYDSPDQPSQQEPVASIGYWNQKTGAYYKPDQISASHQKLIEDGILRRCYTAPPQRTWVGLTDEEILIMSRYDLEYAALIGEVQRKLKEKNCG